MKSLTNCVGYGQISLSHQKPGNKKSRYAGVPKKVLGTPGFFLKSYNAGKKGGGRTLNQSSWFILRKHLKEALERTEILGQRVSIQEIFDRLALDRSRRKFLIFTER